MAGINMKRFIIQLNRTLKPLLLHPCENVHFTSREAAEEHVKMLREDPKNEYTIFEYDTIEIAI